MEQLSDGFKKLAKNSSDSADGIGEAKEAFKKMDIDVKDSNGHLLNNIDIMYKIADRFSKMRDGGLKTALAMQVFGRSGAELIPLLNEGSSGLREMQIEARALGLEISTQTGKQAEEFNDKITKLEFTLKGLAIKALPWVTDQLSRLNWSIENFSWGNLLLSDSQIDRLMLLEKFKPLQTYHQMPQDLEDTISKWKEEEAAEIKSNCRW